MSWLLCGKYKLLVKTTRHKKWGKYVRKRHSYFVGATKQSPSFLRVSTVPGHYWCTTFCKLWTVDEYLIRIACVDQAQWFWMLTSLKFSDVSFFVAAMSLKEEGKLLESKVYDTLQLQVSMCTLRLLYFAVKFIVFLIFIRSNWFNAILNVHLNYFVKEKVQDITWLCLPGDEIITSVSPTRSSCFLNIKTYKT